MVCGAETRADGSTVSKYREVSQESAPATETVLVQNPSDEFGNHSYAAGITILKQ